MVFISSVSTDLKVPGESVYTASKAGVEACAETLRKELQDQDIKITIIQPGSVRTPMQGEGHGEKTEAVARHEMLEPQEIAKAIRYVLTRPAGTMVANLRIEPLKQNRE
ncbi:SDR family oxidoreductase [Asticcacaulis tiandongensis]|uniref:SDR family oxidoreductase n=1 Tax=Asticcacaulis tiandongensis TaxID=2565365 RepID=UPI0015E843ED|nr:SDR family NAD(P)-dependent oxidoreductase [Asticcacaulis tiandongensis]